MKPDQPRIDWESPPPRSGLPGAIDRFIGPGATAAELGVQILFVVLGGFFLIGYALWRDPGWTVFQHLLAVVLGLDMVGGMITNSTSAAKRWYHRPGQSFGRKMGFISLHLAHVFLVAWLFRGMDWLYFGAFAGYLLLSAALVLKTGLYLRRPVAFGLFAVSVLAANLLFSPTPGLEWFIPFLFLKLLVCHLLREEPYRPFAYE